MDKTNSTMVKHNYKLKGTWKNKKEQRGVQMKPIPLMSSISTLTKAEDVYPKIRMWLL